MTSRSLSLRSVMLWRRINEVGKHIWDYIRTFSLEALLAFECVVMFIVHLMYWKTLSENTLTGLITSCWLNVYKQYTYIAYSYENNSRFSPAIIWGGRLQNQNKRFPLIPGDILYESGQSGPPVCSVIHFFENQKQILFPALWLHWTPHLLDRRPSLRTVRRPFQKGKPVHAQKRPLFKWLWTQPKYFHYYYYYYYYYWLEDKLVCSNT